MNTLQRPPPGVTFLYLLFAFTVSQAVAAFDPVAFEEKIATAGRIYEKYVSDDATKQLFIEGRSSESTVRLVSLVPDSDKSPVDHFVLGNMLFVQDRDASYRHMKTAERLMPDNPLVLFERGIHEHRSNNFEHALDYYRRYHASAAGAGTPASWAYMTHALLMTGQVEEALDAWQRARFDRNHTAIEKAMYTIFSTANQEKDREQLVSEINAGDVDKLCDLWTLDSNWEVDWWNHRKRKDYLVFDRALAARRVQDGSREADYFEFCISAPGLDGAEYVDRLERLGILGGDKRLPESGALIYEILRRLMADEMMTAAQFLELFESQIQAYAGRNPSQRRYFDVLAYLYSSTGNRDALKTVDAHGWHVLKLEKFAGSYMVGLDPGADTYEAQLDAALSDFPHSVILNRLRLARAGSRKEKALATFVASQFANVKNNWKGPYRLGDFMASLRHELDKL